ncbi:MAG TPA: response regulator [Nitrososphaeraceae archaeon]|nr:response regulator [Nitrososphaeraceae archaeon]
MTIEENVKISTTKGKKLLIIDDESDIIFTIKSSMEENDFKVDSFTDTISALDNYQINFYDLVILDIKMPKMDGFQLYMKIREKDPKIKICFLTASELYYEEFRKMHHELGKTINEDYFIQKPIRNEDLVKHLTQIINNKN